jgi:hypothetical protein
MARHKLNKTIRKNGFLNNCVMVVDIVATDDHSEKHIDVPEWLALSARF